MGYLHLVVGGLGKHPKFHGATPTTGGWSTTSTRKLPGQGLVTYPRGLLAWPVRADPRWREVPWDQCWRLYRHGSWYGVFLTVGASMLVERTGRCDQMFLTDLARHVRHALALDALDVVGRP
jgi:hypothetical protein